MQAMEAIADQVTLEDVHAIARSFFSFIGDYGHEAEARADHAANPGKFYTPGPIRTTSIIACVPTVVMESGDAIEGGISARAGASMSTGGHLDGSDIDVDKIVQPGSLLEVESEEPPVPGSIKCAPRARAPLVWLAVLSHRPGSAVYQGGVHLQAACGCGG